MNCLFIIIGIILGTVIVVAYVFSLLLAKFMRDIERKIDNESSEPN